MTKRTKIIVITLLSLSVVLFLIGGFASNWNIAYAFAGNYKTEIYTFTENSLAGIKVEQDNMDIVFEQTTKVSKITLKAPIYNGTTTSCYRTQNTGYIEYINTIDEGTKSAFGGLFFKPVFKVQIPSSLKNLDLQIKGSNLNVTMKNITFKSCKINISHIDSGFNTKPIKLTNVECTESCTIYSQSSGITLKNYLSTNGTLNLSTGNGEVEIDDCILNEMVCSFNGKTNFEVEDCEAKKTSVVTSSGEIDFDSFIADEITIETVNGDIDIDNCSISFLSIVNNLADTQINNLLTQGLSVQSQKGDINVSIEGDMYNYEFTIKSMNIDNYLPNESGSENYISLITEQGNVICDFYHLDD